MKIKCRFTPFYFAFRPVCIIFASVVFQGKMEFVQSIIENNGFPVVTAFLLGVIVALHPCPLATNIAAMGYLAKDAHRRRRVFANCMAYTFGRMLAYSLLGVVLLAVFRGSGGFEAAGRWFGQWGEKVLAPVLIIIGLYFILDRFLHKHEHCPNVSERGRRFHGSWGGLLLGVLLAMSFCPESAIVYFGMLMPLSAQSSWGYLLPVVFSVATSLPAVILAWVVAYGIGGTDSMRAKMHRVQRWIGVVVGVLFICAGVFCMFN